MENDIPKSPSNASKIIMGVFLFCYFGVIIIPQWFYPLSALFMLWVLAFPFIITVLIAKGIRSGAGLWREKTKKIHSDSESKFWVWLASLSLLWFSVSIALANVTHFAYSHQKFDPEKWKTSTWEDGGMLELSSRERMLDDLIDNTLPGCTKTEIIKLLGQPDERTEIEGEEILFYYTGWNIMEPKCLFIRFDEHGIISEYYMTLCG